MEAALKHRCIEVLNGTIGFCVDLREGPRVCDGGSSNIDCRHDLER